MAGASCLIHARGLANANDVSISGHVLKDILIKFETSRVQGTKSRGNPRTSPNAGTHRITTTNYCPIKKAFYIDSIHIRRLYPVYIIQVFVSSDQ